MENKLNARKLSNDGLFIFNSDSKDLYLISSTNVKDWEASRKDAEALNELVKKGKAAYFDKTMLFQISDALAKIALLQP